jgi:plastocyanin domain-containing protein
MNKSTYYGVGILLLIAFGGFFMTQGGPTQAAANQPAPTINGEIQEVVVGMKDFNYHPNTIKVKSNQPVRMYLDESVFGCFRDLTLRDFGIQKYLPTPSDYVEFTPTKKGKFTFACSMGMGYGKLVVE